MIFVTVGTHEQQFNRLIKKIDELKEQGAIREPVFIQSGYSTYEPKHCQWKKLLPYKEMEEKIRTAHIVITPWRTFQFYICASGRKNSRGGSEKGRVWRTCK